VNLAKAIAFAVAVHTGQEDKAGEPYILHPLRVLFAVGSDNGLGNSEAMVAVLHDVIEMGGPRTRANLRGEGFPQDVLDAIDAITRQGGESYEDYIERCSKNAIATKVKMRDLEDNMNLGRLPNPQPKDHARVARYRAAMMLLRGEVPA
jgi:(p)ppGpp synthase/HD superfamily hydrolase